MEVRLIDGNKVGVGMAETWQKAIVKLEVDQCPTINPETLTIVQELRKELERVTKERDEITNLCGKLVVICDQPRDKWKEVFQKYNLSMFGDYMGSGYPFVDAFNRIYDEFIYTSSDGAYKLVKESAEKEFQSIQSKRKPLEVKEDE